MVHLLNFTLGGGDSWLTQSFPTNFHVFLKRKLLAPTESANAWMEVTDKEKAALEASDAAWVRPPQSFIDLWNEASGEFGKYNESTGFFELNGLTDITYEEALKIYEVGAPESPNMICRYAYTEIRTNLPPMFNRRASTVYTATTARIVEFSTIEVLNIGEIYWDSELNVGLNFVEFPNAGSDSKKYPLRKIIGTINAYYTLKNLQYSWKLFNDTIEEFTLTDLQVDLKLDNCPKINLETFKTMVGRASNTSPITITVHADVFAKLTDESGHPDWFALNQQAAERQISFASA